MKTRPLAIYFPLGHLRQTARPRRLPPVPVEQRPRRRLDNPAAASRQLTRRALARLRNHA